MNDFGFICGHQVLLLRTPRMFVPLNISDEFERLVAWPILLTWNSSWVSRLAGNWSICQIEANQPPASGDSSTTLLDEQIFHAKSIRLYCSLALLPLKFIFPVNSSYFEIDINEITTPEADHGYRVWVQDLRTIRSFRTSPIHCWKFAASMLTC